MGIRLSAIGVGRLAAFLIMLVVYGAWTIYRGVDHWLNYSRVPAVVDSIDELCRPAATDGARREALDRDPVWGRGSWGDCGAAERYVSGDRHLHVVRGQIASIRYVSPADRREHSARLDLHRVSDAKAVATGGRLAILAHDRDPLTFDPS